MCDWRFDLTYYRLQENQRVWIFGMIYLVLIQILWIWYYSIIYIRDWSQLLRVLASDFFNALNESIYSYRFRVDISFTYSRIFFVSSIRSLRYSNFLVLWGDFFELIVMILLWLIPLAIFVSSLWAAGYRFIILWLTFKASFMLLIYDAWLVFYFIVSSAEN